METHNAGQNPDGEKTFLLPMAVAEGSPTHPAYPSGHAINLGGYITALKVITILRCSLGAVNPFLDRRKLTGELMTRLRVSTVRYGVGVPYRQWQGARVSWNYLTRVDVQELRSVVL